LEKLAMKKSLVALAVLAATGTAFAQSSVTIKGIIKGGFAQTKLSGAGSGSQSAINDGSSQFHIAGTEDLGGGLKAVFQIDTRFRVDDNGGAGAAPTAAIPSQLATGNTYVGLTSSWGGISIGKRDTHYCYGQDTHSSRATALQASSCGLLGYVGGLTTVLPGGTISNSIANASRSSNVIRYDLPTMGGLNGYFAYSTAPFGTEGAPGATSKGNGYALQLTYASGPLTIGGSLWKAKGENRAVPAVLTPIVDQKAFTLAGGWNFGFATVGLTLDRSQISPTYIGVASADAKRNAWSIPVTVPMGAGTFLFTYTKAGDVKVNGATAADSGASLWSLGYDYALSKRTSVGVSYAVLDNKGNANYSLYTQGSLGSTFAPGYGVDQKQLYLGIRHAF
jgi:predicted porin